jgi:hypothetical protein
MPIRIGIPMKNTMVAPCIVNSWLNTSGETTLPPGQNSFQRMTSASQPATTRKNRTVTK